MTPKKRARISTQTLTDEERVEAKRIYLETLAESGVVGAACKAAQVSRQTISIWKEHDDDFKLACQDAEIDADDVLNQEIYRRAVLGVDKPVIAQGRLILNKDGSPMLLTEYSDTLLMFRAKRRMPEYRDKLEHSGPGGGPIPISLTHLTNDELEFLERMAEKAHDDSQSQPDARSTRHPG